MLLATALFSQVFGSDSRQLTTEFKRNTPQKCKDCPRKACIALPNTNVLGWGGLVVTVLKLTARGGAGATGQLCSHCVKQRRGTFPTGPLPQRHRPPHAGLPPPSPLLCQHAPQLLGSLKVHLGAADEAANTYTCQTHRFWAKARRAHSLTPHLTCPPLHESTNAAPRQPQPPLSVP